MRAGPGTIRHVRRRRASQRRWPYLPSLVLLVAGIGLGVFAILLLPSGSSGPVPGQFSVVVSVPPAALTNLDIYEHREAGDTVLEIRAIMPIYPATQYAYTTIYLYYPAGNSAHCEQASSLCYNFTKNGPIVFTLTQVNGAPGGFAEASGTVFFSGPPLGAYSDDNAATTQLPQVQLPIEIGQISSSSSLRPSGCITHWQTHLPTFGRPEKVRSPQLVE